MFDVRACSVFLLIMATFSAVPALAEESKFAPVPLSGLVDCSQYKSSDKENVYTFNVRGLTLDRTGNAHRFVVYDRKDLLLCLTNVDQNKVYSTTVSVEQLPARSESSSDILALADAIIKRSSAQAKENYALTEPTRDQPESFKRFKNQVASNDLLLRTLFDQSITGNQLPSLRELSEMKRQALTSAGELREQIDKMKEIAKRQREAATALAAEETRIKVERELAEQKKNSGSTLRTPAPASPKVETSPGTLPSRPPGQANPSGSPSANTAMHVPTGLGSASRDSLPDPGSAEELLIQQLKQQALAFDKLLTHFQGAQRNLFRRTGESDRRIEVTIYASTASINVTEGTDTTPTSYNVAYTTPQPVATLVFEARSRSYARFGVGAVYSFLKEPSYRVGIDKNGSQQIQVTSNAAGLMPVLTLSHYWQGVDEREFCSLGNATRVSGACPWVNYVFPSVVIGLPLTKTPFSHFFVGGQWQPISGLSVIGGAHIGKVKRLTGGLSPGDMPPDNASFSIDNATEEYFGVNGFVGATFTDDLLVKLFAKMLVK